MTSRDWLHEEASEVVDNLLADEFYDELDHHNYIMSRRQKWVPLVSRRRNLRMAPDLWR